MRYFGRFTRESGVAFPLVEKLVEKEIKGCNPAVTSNDEIRPGVSWWLSRAARYPWNPPGVA